MHRPKPDKIGWGARNDCKLHVGQSKKKNHKI